MKRNSLVSEELNRLGHLAKAITLALAAAPLIAAGCTGQQAPADQPTTPQNVENPPAEAPEDDDAEEVEEEVKQEVEEVAEVAELEEPDPTFVPATHAPPAPDGHKRAGKCDAKLNPTQHDSVLEEARSHKRVDDFHRRYPAQSITSSHTAVKATSEFRANGRNILFYTRDHDVVVNGALSTSLEVARPTRMRKGDTAVVGTLSTAGARMDGLSWVEFLIAASAIQTWMHIEANLCVTIEKAEDDRFIADVKGTHVYFTNDRNEDDIHFSVEIDGRGVITVEGR